jgi:tetratricopeptide (TPR) repeat protein
MLKAFGRFFRLPVVHLLLVSAIGLLAYSNTLDVPFQWDEQRFIVENPVVQNFSLFFAPSEAEHFEYYSAVRNRYAGYMSFALNHAMHGAGVRGYHIGNLLIHLVNALLLYYLVILTFRTPFLQESALKSNSHYVALFTSALFVTHPVQTEAVTYIFQRFASFATFFYLLSIGTYVQSRLVRRRSAHYALYFVSLVSAILAMKTKENAVTLPVTILLYEFFFLSGEPVKRLFRLIPFLLTLLVIPMTLAGTGKPLGETIGGMEAALRGSTMFSPWEYFATQTRVVLTYLRLLVLPFNQNFGYDYPSFHSMLNGTVLLAAAIHALALGLAFYCWRVSQKSHRHWRVAAFGILWFYVTLSIESSVIPIPMLINEYRAYLPSVGFFLTFSVAVLLALAGLPERRKRAAAVLIACLVPVAMAGTTYTRNSTWQSQASLWEDVVRKSRQKAEAHNHLGVAFRAAGETDRAIEHYREAVRLRPDYAMAYNNLGVAYGSKGLLDEAIRQYRIAISHDPDYPEAHNNLGNTLDTKGLTAQAIREYKIALSLKPDYPAAHYNIGIAYQKGELLDEAVEHYLEALRLRPDYPEALNNLGLAFKQKGLLDKAVALYEEALEASPEYTDARINLANAYYLKRRIDEAITHYLLALKTEPGNRTAHYNLGLAYEKKGLPEEAEKHYGAARGEGTHSK